MTIGIRAERGLLKTGDIQRYRRVAAVVLGEMGVTGDAELSLSFVSDAEMRGLNAAHRGINRTTDVLSFSQEHSTDDVHAVVLGDVVISLDTAARQAPGYGNSVYEEVCRLMVHGILHLLGYDHKKAGERLAMREREDELLAALRKRLERRAPPRSPRAR